MNIDLLSDTISAVINTAVKEADEHMSMEERVETAKELIRFVDEEILGLSRWAVELDDYIRKHS
jgi:hypothetical protein